METSPKAGVSLANSMEQEQTLIKPKSFHFCSRPTSALRYISANGSRLLLMLSRLASYAPLDSARLLTYLLGVSNSVQSRLHVAKLVIYTSVSCINLGDDFVCFALSSFVCVHKALKLED